MLSLKELHRAGRNAEELLVGSVVQRMLQPDDFRLFLSLYGSGKASDLLLSCRPGFARISMPGELPKAAASPPPFLQYLRAHLGRAVFKRCLTYPSDRRAALWFTGREGEFRIVLSILGTRSNVYLLDGEGRLLFAMRPLDETRRELVIGEPWTDPAGKLKSEGEDRWEHTPDERYLSEVEKTYSRLEIDKEIEALSRRLELAIEREERFLERKAGNLVQDLGEAAKAEEHRRKGELLKLVLHTVKPGDEQAEATDFQTGERVVIPIDPRLSPSENLQVYFKRYQKELRGVAALQEQMENLRRAQDRVEELQLRLRGIAGLERDALAELKEFAAQPLMRRLLARHHPSPKTAARTGKTPAGKKEVPARLLPRRYRTEEGLEVWVGRSDEGNDWLTNRLARGNDLFFHLEGYPGSHVILRTERNKAPAAESILEACELAVHFSKLKNADRADVHVAAVKDIRKPKGAKPGLVYVGKGKTVHLRRDPRRLENILSSRLEE